MREVNPLLKAGAAFAAGALLTWLIGDALLRWRDAMVDDEERLRQRVRARIAQLVSYPEAIQVQVDGGMVRVSGRVLAGELDRLLSQLTQVPRVFRVYNALDSVPDANGFELIAAGRLGGLDSAPS